MPEELVMNLTTPVAHLSDNCSMRGGGHSNYQHNEAKREQWLEEMAARPEIGFEDLLGLFNDPEFIRSIDEQQKELQKQSVASLIGFSALDGATKNESRLLTIARSNMAMYEDDVEDVIFEDPIMRELIDPRVQETHRSDEGYTAAVRLRRTVIAYFYAFDDYLEKLAHPDEPTNRAVG